MTRLTDEQRTFANHLSGAFVEACPGAGKTRTIVQRIARIAATLPPRRGLAVLSFTNSAIEEFVSQCHAHGLDGALRHPGFVGTFDSFLRQFFFSPSGIDGVTLRPVVVDSWETLGVDVRLRGANMFHGDGVSLDLFDAGTNAIDPASIGHAGLRAHVQAHQGAYQQAAGWRRRALRERGYLSAADVRVDVVRRLHRADWPMALGRAILELVGKIDEGEMPSRAAERRGVDRRWLRRSALELITRIPRSCAGNNEARTAWVAALRQQVQRLGLVYTTRTSECRYFTNRTDADWHRLLMSGDAPEFACATIHEAKGREYDAICVVIPPDIREPRRIEQLFIAWQNRMDDEAKRVIYVAITRARKLGVIAIPAAFRDRLIAILEAAQTNWRVHDV
jgi:hypothetical protein